MNFYENIFDTFLSSPLNMAFVGIIFVLAVVDLVLKKDLKSQIVSVGVLGTFVGIFIGLQDFNPLDMKGSINTILIGLKTAFFTSIVGMFTAISLSVIQKIFYKELDDERSVEKILLDISKKLENTHAIDGIGDKLEKIRLNQENNTYELNNNTKTLVELKENSSRENTKLIGILDTNFEKMNDSLTLAVEKLSEGATKEIIKALENVIQEFNQELQTQFGENFIKLNESVINLLKWQDNYKSHIEDLENRLKVSTSSIEKSKDSLEIISSKNEDIMTIYKNLSSIIKTNDMQIQDLNRHLSTFGQISNNAQMMFTTITENIDQTKDEFTSLADVIKQSNESQKESFKSITDEIQRNFEKNKEQLSIISNHFKELGLEVPKALDVSLNELNRGLTTLTTKFQKDYDEIMNKYKAAA